MKAQRDGRGLFLPENTIGLATRWQPGECGNPNGRPREYGIRTYQGFNGWKSKQWQKGHSGNPKGRKPGTGWRQKAERIMDGWGDYSREARDQAQFAVLSTSRYGPMHTKALRHLLGYG
ncbi:MAG: DUF5681 domain-containing protein [Spirochaetia bacterium]